MNAERSHHRSMDDFADVARSAFAPAVASVSLVFAVAGTAFAPESARDTPAPDSVVAAVQGANLAAFGESLPGPQATYSAA